MRITPVIFVGSLAALVTTAAPALAKNSQTPRADEQATSSSPCRAYQQAADGSWKELPCQGQAAAAPRRQQSVTTTSSSATR
ncbi:conserved exported protein of unknown function [Bradyrhizobium sp. ORS 285]|uniref:hypothetical protein n=1 Tax=Bradyrhizobium sp. ORS 285 TaxID=115808 RepID=UPI0002409ACF|nr:hypothetical protein [Bradyrhizobium sp. ORS 285]CCD88173.1 conserved exported hypothetical protein [Bradyrhizobium sp. ORS 285]SMX58847.1 conserved exported protein of unknown function [Bradyrhizobium sp. ORS 285]